MPGAVNFDPAADVYDAARITPPDAEARAVEALRDAIFLKRGERLLEIAVGTGRVAAPIRDHAGARVIGIDISARMLAKARGKGIEVARSDATALPFRDGAFRASIFVHALHLIPGWREAIKEAARVAPTIVVSMGIANDESTPMAELRGELRRIGAARGVPVLEQPGGRGEAVVAELRSRGFARREIPGASWEERFRPSAFVANVEKGAYATTWDWTPAFREHALAELTRFAEKRWGSADAELSIQSRFAWDVYDPA